MKTAYALMVLTVLLVFLAPVYVERHALTNTLRSTSRDCYTTLNAQTVCTNEDIAAFIGFAGLALVAGLLMFLASVGITYPIARRFDLV